MTDTDDIFLELAQRLRVDKRCESQSLIVEFWLELVAKVRRDEDGTIPLHVRLRMEQALELRVVTFRLQPVLGEARLFEKRTKGAATGLRAVHPVAELLQQQHEKLQEITKELLGVLNAPEDDGPIGLNKRIAEVLRETEGILEQALVCEESDEGDEGNEDTDADFP